MPKVKSILRTTIVCVAIALICLFGFLMLQNMFAEIFIRCGWETQRTVDLFTDGFGVAFLAYAVLPPLLEELLFRWGLCKLLKLTKLNNVGIIFISAVLFMLYHWSWSQLVYQLVMGIFFAWIYLKTDHIGWTMLIHFINNAFIVTYTYLAGNTATAFNLQAGNIILAIALAQLSAAAVIFLIIKGIPNDAKK